MAWHESQRSFDVVRGHGGRPSAVGWANCLVSLCVIHKHMESTEMVAKKNPLLVVLDRNIQYSSKLVVKKQQKTSK